MLTTETVSAERPETSVDFNRDVRPIFNQHCVACHGGVKQAADLSFVYAESVLELVEPGSWQDSYLMERILLPTDDEEHMPPIDHGRPLNASEIATLKNWIESGSHWGKHWAFDDPKRHPLTEVKPKDWARKRIDGFVLSRMREAGLEPQSESSPQRWLRRAS